MSGGGAAKSGPETEWGRFISEDQADDLLSLSRAFNCAANLLTGGDKAVLKGDAVALFRLFAMRIEDIVGDDLPIIELVLTD